MSYATRFFQMRGAQVAQIADRSARLTEHQRIGKLLGAKGSWRLGKAYANALNAATPAKVAALACRNKMLMPQQYGRAERPAKMLAVTTRQAMQPYAVGNVYRPKRANQHSRNIVVKGLHGNQVFYLRQGDVHERSATTEEFAALIGRKVE